MSAQVRFFEKNKADFSDSAVVATASQGVGFEVFALNRSNLSAWVTTGSVDADNTTFTIDFGDLHTIDSVILITHNFKAYTVKYWDGAAYQAFSTPINETTNTKATTFHQFNSVSTTKVQLTITGTQVANEDKYLFQFIVTKEIGQLNSWPVIDSPVISRNKASAKMISGKTSIREQIGFMAWTLSVAILSDSSDLDLIESLYLSNNGFLVWLCGGDEDQFSSKRIGYRLVDLPLMKCLNEYQPKFYEGLYKAGLVINVDLVEVVD